MPKPTKKYEEALRPYAEELGSFFAKMAKACNDMASGGDHFEVGALMYAVQMLMLQPKKVEPGEFGMLLFDLYKEDTELPPIEHMIAGLEHDGPVGGVDDGDEF